jgi:hypothetical protein
MHKILLFALFAALQTTSVFCRDVCFEFDLISSHRDESAAIVQGDKFLHVNGFGVPFTTVNQRTEQGGVIYTQNRGCMSDKHLFDSPNELNFSIASSDGGPIVANLSISLFVLIPKKPRKQLSNRVWEKGTISSEIKFLQSFSLQDLDPAKAQRLENEKKKKNDQDKLEKDLREKHAKLKAESAALEESHKKRLNEIDQKIKEKNEINTEKAKQIDTHKKEMLSSIDQALALLGEMEIGDDVSVDMTSTEAFCFPAGTLVKTMYGEARIEDLKEGDWVVANDSLNSSCALAEVERLYEHEVSELVEMTLGKETLFSTPNHPLFIVEEEDYLRADQIKVEQHLLSVSGKNVSIDSLRTLQFQIPVKVYNIKVRNYHNYFVGSQHVFTHNCDGFLHGAEEVFVDTLSGIKEAIFHPIDTVITIAEAVQHIDEIAVQAAKKMAEVLVEFPEYSASEKGELVGKLTAELAAILAPGAVMKAGSHLSKIAANTKFGTKVVEAMELAAREAGLAYEGVYDSWKAHPERGGIGDAGSNFIPKSRVDHYQNGHNLEKFIEQSKNRPKESSEIYLKNNSFFNKGWSETKINDAVQKTFEEAISQGVSNGRFSTIIEGEKITIGLKDGSLRSAWGNKKYTLQDIGLE